MAAINFPSSPSNGDTHTVGGVTYTYNSAETKWKTTINSNAFLALTGGNVTGNLSVDTDTLFVDASTDRVGINTSSPQANLHIGNGTGNGVEIGNNGTLQVIDRGNSRIEPLTVTAEHVAFSIARNTSTTLHDERARVTYDGLTFNGDTAAANALDDYEEGTFTPAYGGPGGTPGAAAFTSAGYYVKVGRSVTVWGLVTLTNKGSYSDTVILGSLPYTASSTSSIQHLGSAWLQNITFPADESFVSRVGPNESQITFPRQPDTVDYLKISDLNNNSILRWTVTYRTND